MSRIFDIGFSALLVFAGMMLAERAEEQGFADAWLGETINWHLGAEYNNIAQAIYSGRGFSDPFDCGSGPTAWMPPVLPYVLAGLYWLTDFQPEAVVEIVLGLKAIVLVLSGFIVLAEARRLGVAWVGFVVWTVGLLVNFYEYFQITHDLWLLLLVINVVWIGATKFWNVSRGWRSITWGGLGGFAALCSPAVAASWAFLTIAISFRSKPLAFGQRLDSLPIDSDALIFSRRMQALAISALVSIVVVAPWMLRNYMAFEKWIPIKSNSGFEIWQAQCKDDDGVLDRMLTADHPYASNGVERKRYLQLGEASYLTEKTRVGWSCIASDPVGYLIRCGHRCMAAFFWYYPYSDASASRVWPLWIKRAVFPLALISLIAMLIWSKDLELEFTSAATIVLIVLLPYVLVSYGDRYAAPLLPLKCVLILHAAAFLGKRSRIAAGS